MADDSWKLHDIYAEDVSSNRIVTRSQTAFLRIKNTSSDVELFADKKKHQPKNMPHLMNTLKGTYGAVPKTIITRSCGRHIPVSEELCKKVDLYKEDNPEHSKGNPDNLPRRRSSIFEKLSLF